MGGQTKHHHHFLRFCWGHSYATALVVPYVASALLCYVQYCFELCDFSLGDISSIISLQPALKFNGGGHINHSIFWTNLSPDGGGEPTGAYLYKKK